MTEENYTWELEFEGEELERAKKIKKEIGKFRVNISECLGVLLKELKKEKKTVRLEIFKTLILIEALKEVEKVFHNMKEVVENNLVESGIFQKFSVEKKLSKYIT